MTGRAVGMLVGLLAGTTQEGGVVTGTVTATGARVTGTVVWLVPAAPVPISARPDSALIDQVGLRFLPQVISVSVGATVVFRNSDPILHNVFSPSVGGGGFDLGRYPRTEWRSNTFARAGAHVILCHVHPEMVAYVVVAPTPYHAVVTEGGRFQIENVPPGRYILRGWHRFLDVPDQELTVPAGGGARVELMLRPASR